jgi:hypothetical protein
VTEAVEVVMAAAMVAAATTVRIAGHYGRQDQREAKK